MIDDVSYNAWLESKQHEWESMCIHCGACCGAFDEDPCSQLVMSPDGKSSCRVYENRLGPQQGVSGKPFTCITVRQKLGEYINSWPGDERCAYKKALSRISS